MFAQFFISPSFKQDSTEREMNAVDSEYNQSLQNDAWKFFSLIEAEAIKDSALNRFNCGNLESLKQDGIREALLDFHKKYYSANIMKLVASSKNDIETMEKWVVELFSPIENKNVVIPALNVPKSFDETNMS